MASVADDSVSSVVPGTSRASAPWLFEGYATTWAANDGLASLLQIPWRMATALVGLQSPPRVVVDVGSGPGTFLGELLTQYPQARGVWLDASTEMLAAAQTRLAAHGDRVTYLVGDMNELARLDLPQGVDVITNSRVAHHFRVTELQAFYQAGHDLLAPGGWLVTLDHIRPSEFWNASLRTVLPLFAGPGAGKPTHPHYYPFPTPEEHLGGLRAAGFVNVDMPWRAFYTCLFMGQKPAAAAE
jgi:SAM-dependent methyltransferase